MARSRQPSGRGGGASGADPALTAALAEALKPLAEAVKALGNRASAADTGLSALSAATRGGGGAQPGQPLPLPGAGGAQDFGTSKLTAGFEAVLGPLAGVTKQFDGLIGAIAPFVSALNPGAMALLNDAMRNLQATVGQALLPVVEVLTDVFNQASGALGPVMRELAPVAAKFAQVLTAAVIPEIEFLASVLDLLAPAFEVLIDLMKPYQEILALAYKALAVFVDILKGVFGTGFKAVFEQFMGVIQLVIKNLVLLAAAVAKAFGAVDFLKKFSDDLKKPPPEREQNAAPTNAAFKAFDQIQKDLALAAATAMGTGEAAKTDNALLGEISKGVDDILAGKADVMTFIRHLFIDEVPPILAKAIVAAIKEGQEVFNRAADALRNGPDSGLGVGEAAQSRIQRVPGIPGGD
jgi:hypothetical protein